MTKLVGMECFEKSFGGNKLIRCELDNWMIAALAQSQSTRVSNLTMVTTGGPPKPSTCPQRLGQITNTISSDMLSTLVVKLWYILLLHFTRTILLSGSSASCLC